MKSRLLGKSHPQTRRRISALQQLPDGGAQKHLSMSVRILLCLHNEWRTQANQTPASSAFVRQPKQQKPPPAGNWAYYLTSSHKPFGRALDKKRNKRITRRHSPAFAIVKRRSKCFPKRQKTVRNSHGRTKSAVSRLPKILPAFVNRQS